jgi:hypothetical protein
MIGKTHAAFSASQSARTHIGVGSRLELERKKAAWSTAGCLDGSN